MNPVLLVRILMLNEVKSLPIYSSFFPLLKTDITLSYEKFCVLSHITNINDIWQFIKTRFFPHILC